jgi:hypothetical protein
LVDGLEISKGDQNVKSKARRFRNPQFGRLLSGDPMARSDRSSLNWNLAKPRLSLQHAMVKRKVKEEDDSVTSTASSSGFSSFVSQYSYSATSSVEVDSKPSATPLSPPLTPKNKKQKALVRTPSGKLRNPGYAPPSTYSHLPTPDLDSLTTDLVLLFIGLNPGMSHILLY